jgi:Uri superfamily endonuclease
MKGSYILLLRLERDEEILIGKLGRIFFKKGFYGYVGSALSGLDSRIKRHLRGCKKIHWHIDYLLQKSEIVDVLYKEGGEECSIAGVLITELQPIGGFGSSDCDCRSHLFYGSREKIVNIASNLDMKRYVVAKF